MGARFLVIAAVLVFAVATARASATSVATLPLAPTASSLAQSGQELTWTVVTAQPFRPKSLAKQGLSLCLMIAQGAKTVRLCVAGPARILDASTGRYVKATVTRSSLDQLAASFTPTSVGLQYRPVHWQVMSTLTVPPCAAGAGCEIEFPSSPASSRLHMPQLVGCVPSGPRWVFNGPSNRKQIALTFDDGPWYLTGQFVSLLDRYHVPATFFEIGDQIAEFGEGGAIERRMLADGDMIGDHTWNHPDVAGAGAFAQGEIVRAAAAIKHATGGFEPCLFRAPYGDVSPALLSLARSLGFTTIQWDIDPRDWALPGVGAIYGNVLANAHPGAIVIQHDGGGDRSETLAALPTEIRVLRSRGYQFVTVTQLLGMRLLYR